jgi:Peptidase family C54
MRVKAADRNNKNLSKDIREQLISLFFDNSEAQYSIHNICKQGIHYDAQIGEYWRPLTSVICLAHLSKGIIYDNSENEILKVGSTFNEGKHYRK